MAVRKVFRVSEKEENFTDEVDVEFKWYLGFAILQKQKSIKELHRQYEQIYKEDMILEISSKSESDLGIKLSAFNLMINTKDNRVFSVE